MPLDIQSNVLLKDHTTFKIGGPAKAWIELQDPTEIGEAFNYARTHGLTPLVLGGGSNMLVSDSGYQGLILSISNVGIEIQEDEVPNTRLLRVGSGETWDDVVQFAVEHDLWGLENLSRIPGKMGAFAVQNVGAYGPEAKDVIVQVEAYDIQLDALRVLSNEECEFTYRKSIFNTTHKGRFVILSTLLRLSTVPVRNLTYPDVRQRFPAGTEPTQREIRQAIKEIRDAKFPFPAESVEGNAGSFFKNSVIDEEQYAELLSRFRQFMPQHVDRLEQIRHKFPQPTGIKIPSAFIMEVCDLKGFTMGNVQLNPTQPVVVLNKTGNATAHEVLSLVREVRDIVRRKTGLHLYTEPELIGFTSAELASYGFNEDELARYVPD